MADFNFVHIEDSGTASTPLAGGGLRIDFVVDGTRHDNGAVDLNVSVTGSNFAVTDNAWAAVRVVLSRGDAEVWSDVVQTDQQCPAKGLFGGPTVRSGSRQLSVPAGIEFNRVGVKVRNIDNFDRETVDWAALVELAVEIIVTVAAAA
jgi:hypothetical protein